MTEKFFDWGPNLGIRLQVQWTEQPWIGTQGYNKEQMSKAWNYTSSSSLVSRSMSLIWGAL